MAKDFSAKFYQSKAWQQVRQQVLRRDMFTCQHCESRRATEVHHIVELTPDNINDDEIALNPDNLISLCWWCHNKVTKGSTDVIEGYVFDENGFVVPYNFKEQ